MNNDLISREALKKTFENACIYGLPMNELYGAILKIIDNAPTVDAVVNTIEVRPQGKWKVERKHPFYYVCNKCGYKRTHKTNFCENCGADMQKGGIT